MGLPWGFDAGRGWSTSVPPTAAACTPQEHRQRQHDPKHLILLVNGLWGSVKGWQKLSRLLVAATAEVNEPTVVVASTVNQGRATYDGIEVCGQRLAAELQALVAAHPSLTHLSVVTHSMGALLARYALGAVYEPGTQRMAGLVPRDFISIAGPHLGCGSTHKGEATSHWRGYFYMALLHSWVHKGLLPRPLLPRSVLQLLALDSAEEMRQPDACGQQTQQPTAAAGAGGHMDTWQQQQQEQQQQQQQQQQCMQQEKKEQQHECMKQQQQQQQQQCMEQEDVMAGGAHMLDLLVADWPAHKLWPVSALRAFQRRTVYAEKGGDHLVSWASASLRAPEQLPNDLPKAAWLQHTAIVQDCRPLGSCTGQDSTVFGNCGGGGGGVCSSADHDQGTNSSSSSSSSDRSPQCSDSSGSEGTGRAAWVHIVPAHSITSKHGANMHLQRRCRCQSQSGSSDSDSSSSPCCAATLVPDNKLEQRPVEAGVLARLFGSSKVRQESPAVREMGMRARLAVLQSMEWRRFDVVFPLLVIGTGHNNIQYNRAMNFAGLPVVQHIIAQLLAGGAAEGQAMEATAA